VWPIGDAQAAAASHDVATRLDRLSHLLNVSPELAKLGDAIQWCVDIPNDEFYHVGGSFNDVFVAWPHNYFVLDGAGRLLFRCQLYTVQPRVHRFEFSDVEAFVHGLLDA
jgi:hypothetical protein